MKITPEILTVFILVIYMVLCVAFTYKVTNYLMAKFPKWVVLTIACVYVAFAMMGSVWIYKYIYTLMGKACLFIMV